MVISYHRRFLKIWPQFNIPGRGQVEINISFNTSTKKHSEGATIATFEFQVFSTMFGASLRLNSFLALSVIC